MRLVWCLTRTLSQHQVNQHGGTLPVHLQAHVVLGHGGVEGLEHDQADTEQQEPQICLTITGIIRSQDSNSCPGECLEISEQRREELGPASQFEVGISSSVLQTKSYSRAGQTASTADSGLSNFAIRSSVFLGTSQLSQ